jgi:hypothetical protein
MKETYYQVRRKDDGYPWSWQTEDLAQARLWLSENKRIETRVAASRNVPPIEFQLVKVTSKTEVLE